MAGGPSKVNAPNGHPSNPIHIAAHSESKTKPPPTIALTIPPTKTQANEPTPSGWIWK